MRAFVYDLESSGMLLFEQPDRDEHQPHIVEAAALLVDTDTRRVVSTLSQLVRPEGWHVHEDAEKVHGISTDYAFAWGMREPLLIDVLLRMWFQAEVRIGFSEAFDSRLLRIGMKRFGRVTDKTLADWKDAPVEDVMHMATPVLQLPKADGHGFKPPKLTEAYELLTGRKRQVEHRALPDVLATLECYFAIKDRHAAGEQLAPEAQTA